MNTFLGRTIPSFRIALAEEQAEWSDYRKYLGKKEKQAFNEMFSTVRLYISACSNAAKPVRIYLVLISILLHHHIELKEAAKTLQISKEVIIRQ